MHLIDLTLLNQTLYSTMYPHHPSLLTYFLLTTSWHVLQITHFPVLHTKYCPLTTFPHATHLSGGLPALEVVLFPAADA